MRAREVRVVDGKTGRQIGILKLDEALKLAREQGLDLIEIAPQANPPVCRIADYGKFRYEQSKQEKERRQSLSATKVKEVKFHVNIDNHDYLTKLRHAEEFLDRGNKLKIVLLFRGRENIHKDLGMDLINRIRNDLATMGNADMEPKLVGKSITLTMSPLPAQKRKRKFSSPKELSSPDKPTDKLQNENH
ncbi:MAG: translation initiation factor IF-3 [Chthoniobacterales bacterium]|nr:translation initiation factor IF-3 [Chthoniobacterales bacterium]